MTQRFYWNRDWQFIPNYSPNETQWENAEVVSLPHTTAEVPRHYFDESCYQMVCAYRREVYAPAHWAGKHLFMTVEAAGHSAVGFFQLSRENPAF